MHKIDQQLHSMIRGDFQHAWEISEMLEKENPNDLRHKFNRGWFLLNQGKFQEGFQSLEAGRFLSAYGSPKIATTKPIWNGQDDLTGKIVIINLEAGYGDNFISARFAVEISKRGGRCVMCCDPTIHSMMKRIEGVSECIVLSQVPSTRHDYWIPGFSCSWLFGHTVETMPRAPYMSAIPASIELWKNVIKSDKLKVGIRWSGNPKFEHQQFRIFPPEPLIDLYKRPELQIYSLQKDNDVKELPEEIVDLQHLLISWEDTAAAIMNMDLVISSCTAIAHLASAMGKPTWVIVPILPYHIWAYGALEGNPYSPWYQHTTRIFRQKRFDSWKETFDELYQHMDKYIENKEQYNVI